MANRLDRAQSGKVWRESEVRGTPLEPGIVRQQAWSLAEAGTEPP